MLVLLLSLLWATTGSFAVVNLQSPLICGVSMGYDAAESPNCGYDNAPLEARDDYQSALADTWVSDDLVPGFIAAKGGVDLATTPLVRNVTGVADDALVHFGSEGYSVIKPGAGGQVFSFRYGDVKHLTPRQVEWVIGDLAAGGQRGGSRVMHILDAAPRGATRTPGAVVSEIPEFIFNGPVPVSGGFIVQ